jgi:hypothetical protein
VIISLSYDFRLSIFVRGSHVEITGELSVFNIVKRVYVFTMGFILIQCIHMIS